LNERSGIRMATACNGLEYAIRFLFAGRPVIGCVVMIRILLSLPKVVEDVMDLMRCRVNDEGEEKCREQKIAPANYGRDISMALHHNRASRRHSTNQDCS